MSEMKASIYGLVNYRRGLCSLLIQPMHHDLSVSMGGIFGTIPSGKNGLYGIVWDGTHWKIDEGGALIHEKNLETVRNIYNELSKTNDYRERIDIEKFAMLSESVRRREAAVKAAAWVKELNITSDELDANPWLLNVRNGTLNVLTGEFTGHKQEDMISKKIA